MDPTAEYVKWAENNIYKIGDVVLFGDKVFKCIKEHQSILSLVPDFWEILKEISQ